MKKKQKKNKDPFAAREAEKYANPVPSREFISQYLEDAGFPLTHGQLLKAFAIETADEREGLRRRLRAMLRDGQLIRTRRGGYGLVNKMDLIRGRVIGHKDGFGFLVPDDGGDDLFLSDRQMRLAFHGDRVLAREIGRDRRGRREGMIIEVTESNTQSIVGRYEHESGIACVVPSNNRITQNILVPDTGGFEVESGQIVSVEITTQPTLRSQAVAKIVEVLGEDMAPGMEIDIAIRAHGLPHEWPDAVLAECDSIKPRVSTIDKQGRVDLRDLPLVTIDGQDAKDFDDAVYCEKMPKNGWRLYVAIADVAHYVGKDSALDQEGRSRGNSVYFPGNVIPMLPEKLSNGLCSLKPKVDRLCMVCEMSISSRGKIRSYKFYEGVMHSHARLTYEKVAAMLVDKDKKLRQRYKVLMPDLLELYAMYKVLNKQRQKRGAIDFEIPEPRILFDKQRRIKRIVRRDRNDAHRIIEECMLAANVCTAEFLLENKMPALYRVHPKPEPEKIDDLKQFLGGIGVSLKGGKKPHPRDYGELLAKVKDRPDAMLIQTVLLRSLSQAQYDSKNAGHFGLAYDAYAHFTSPIRRYPDLLVHRAIKHLLAQQAKKKFPYNKETMHDLGKHCSMTERRADDATREAIDWLKCEFMQNKIDEVFSGTISGVTSFGIFVSLDEHFVDGLVHITALPKDYYHYDNVHQRLTGERAGKRYKLGDQVTISVARVDLEMRQI